MKRNHQIEIEENKDTLFYRHVHGYKFQKNKNKNTNFDIRVRYIRKDSYLIRLYPTETYGISSAHIYAFSLPFFIDHFSLKYYFFANIF